MFEKIKRLFAGSVSNSEKRTGRESYFVNVSGKLVEISRLDYLDHGGID